MSVRVSVAMATYNGAKFIRQQLDSIQAQKRQPFEIVITDDGSTDDTVAIAQEFANRAPFPVVVARNERNLGFANNFLKCAAMCRGNWIAFCDQDDVWYPQKLERMAAVVENGANSRVVLVTHAMDLVDGNLRSAGRRVPDYPRDVVVAPNTHEGFCCIGGCTMLFRADLAVDIDASLRPRDNFRPYDPASDHHPWLPHDKWISMLANALGETAYVSESLGAYRRHELAQTGDKAAPSIAERIRKAAAVTGGEYYAFHADVAVESAASLRAIAATLSDRERPALLQASAAKFDRFAAIQRERALLYGRPGVAGRVRSVGALVRLGGYLRDPFYSLGAASLAKDVLFSLGLFARRAAARGNGDTT